jgi:hypothetical protein
MNDDIKDSSHVAEREDTWDDIQDSSHVAEREDTWFEKKYGRLTNLQILIITSVLFTLFVVAEIVGALVSV